MVRERRTMDIDCRSGNLLFEHYGEPRSFDEDGCSDITSYFTFAPDHTSIFSPLYAHCGLFDMVLCLPVSCP